MDDEEFPGLKTGAADKAERLNDKAAAKVLRLRLRIQPIPSGNRQPCLSPFSSFLALASCLRFPHSSRLPPVYSVHQGSPATCSARKALRGRSGRRGPEGCCCSTVVPETHCCRRQDELQGESGFAYFLLRGITPPEPFPSGNSSSPLQYDINPKP